MSLRGWKRILRWTGLGTLSCIAVSVFYNWLAFREMGGEVLHQALVSATVLPIILAVPLFFYLTMKLRELAIANHKLCEQASSDGLTGCLNRTAFAEAVEGWLDERVQAGEAVHGALLVIDADNFKKINDMHGHQEGDRALVTIANAIKAAMRSNDFVGRLGGEEFGVFLPNVEMRSAKAVAERIRRTANRTAFAPGGEVLTLSVSVGCATFDEAISFRELFRIADQRLYNAKSAGRNRVMFTHAGPPEEQPVSGMLH